MNWLQRRRYEADVRNGAEDLKRFLEALRALSGEGRGASVAAAALIRINFRRVGVLPDEALGCGEPLPPELASGVRTKMFEAASFYQTKEDGTDAGATMIWLHTLRALQFPELFDLGRELWRELGEGFDWAQQALDSYSRQTGRPIPDEAREMVYFVPPPFAA